MGGPGSKLIINLCVNLDASNYTVLQYGYENGRVSCIGQLGSWYLGKWCSKTAQVTGRVLISRLSYAIPVEAGFVVLLVRVAFGGSQAMVDY